MAGSHNPEEAARRRLWLGAGALVLAVLLAGGIVAVAMTGARAKHAPAPPAAFTPAQPTTLPAPPSSATTSSASSTSSALATSPASPSSSNLPSGPRIAFRLGLTIYVSAEDGSGATPVIQSASGPYSISPDGRTLAYVDGVSNQLFIVDVSTKQPASEGVVTPVTPVWAPDSSAVYAVRGPVGSIDSQVIRIARSGATVDTLADGATVGIARDGGTVVIGPPTDATGSDARKVTLTDATGHSPQTIRAPGAVTAVAASASSLYVATVDASGSASIWSLAAIGSKPKRIVSLKGQGVPAPVTAMVVSPNGAWLAFAATGDDGYARGATVRTTVGATHPFSQRRDTYPLGFSADSKWVYFIEGNAFQGEQTALDRMNPNGTGKRMVVSGATL